MVVGFKQQKSSGPTDESKKKERTEERRKSPSGPTDESKKKEKEKKLRTPPVPSADLRQAAELLRTSRGPGHASKTGAGGCAAGGVGGQPSGSGRPAMKVDTHVLRQPEEEEKESAPRGVYRKQPGALPSPPTPRTFAFQQHNRLTVRPSNSIR